MPQPIITHVNAPPMRLNSLDGGGGCDDHAAVGVLHCEGFLLWRLPYGRGAAGGAQGDCGYGYCTAPSGL
jgi:hypothetical protein